MGEGLSPGYALPGLLMSRSKTSSWHQYTQTSLNILGNSGQRDNFKHAIEAFNCRPSPLQFLRGAWHQRETRWYWHTWGFWERKLGQIRSPWKASSSREIAGFSFVFWPCYTSVLYLELHTKVVISPTSRKETLAITYPGPCDLPECSKALLPWVWILISKWTIPWNMTSTPTTIVTQSHSALSNRDIMGATDVILNYTYNIRKKSKGTSEINSIIYLF